MTRNRARETVSFADWIRIKRIEMKVKLEIKSNDEERTGEAGTALLRPSRRRNSPLNDSFARFKAHN